MKSARKTDWMARVISLIFGIAISLILAGVLLADSLAEQPGGFIALFAMIGAGGVLVGAGNYLDEWRRHQ